MDGENKMDSIRFPCMIYGQANCQAKRTSFDDYCSVPFYSNAYEVKVIQQIMNSKTSNNCRFSIFFLVFGSGKCCNVNSVPF